jgi:hypothetical protein
MGSYFHKPIHVTLGNDTKGAKAFKTYGDFRSWAHQAFSLKEGPDSYTIYIYGTSQAPTAISSTSHFDNPTRVWLKHVSMSYLFSLAYDLNGPG